MAGKLALACCLLFTYGLFGDALLINQECQKCVTEAYTKEIGVREATGKNDGESVEKYLRSIGLGKGYAWCAAFVHWVLEQCGAARVRSGWCPAWFPEDRVIWSNSTKQNQTNIIPAAGDVFGIYFSSKKRIAHVGFVHDWTNKDYVITVEGNTNEAGSREGDGVYKKRRLKRQIYKVSRWLD